MASKKIGLKQWKLSSPKKLERPCTETKKFLGLNTDTAQDERVRKMTRMAMDHLQSPGERPRLVDETSKPFGVITREIC